MRLQIDGWEFAEAISKWFLEKQDYKLDFDDKEITFSIDIDGKPNLYRYERDTKWNDEKVDFDVLAEYEIEGVYVKRRKKGAEKSQYVKLDEDCYPSMKGIHEGTEININIF
jgi:hypothetical protein